MTKFQKLLSLIAILFISICIQSTTAYALENYTYTPMTGHMYVNYDTNVRTEPRVEGEKVGVIKAYDEVFRVLGRCNETGWYKILYQEEELFISDKYVVNLNATAVVENNTTYSVSDVEVQNVPATPPVEVQNVPAAPQNNAPSNASDSKNEDDATFIVICVIVVTVSLAFIFSPSKSSSKQIKNAKDTSLFGIDWDGDGEVSMADDFETMELMEDD